MSCLTIIPFTILQDPVSFLCINTEITDWKKVQSNFTVFEITFLENFISQATVSDSIMLIIIYKLIVSLFVRPKCPKFVLDCQKQTTICLNFV